jgi:hypothetical protein
MQALCRQSAVGCAPPHASCVPDARAVAGPVGAGCFAGRAAGARRRCAAARAARCVLRCQAAAGGATSGAGDSAEPAAAGAGASRRAALAALASLGFGVGALRTCGPAHAFTRAPAGACVRACAARHAAWR